MKRGMNPLPEPWQYIAVDLIGSFSTGESTLVVVDYYSRFYEVVVMYSTTAGRVIYNLPEEAKECVEDVDPVEAGRVAPVSELLEDVA